MFLMNQAFKKQISLVQLSLIGLLGERQQTYSEQSRRCSKPFTSQLTGFPSQSELWQELDYARHGTHHSFNKPDFESRVLTKLRG